MPEHLCCTCRGQPQAVQLCRRAGGEHSQHLLQAQPGQEERTLGTGSFMPWGEPEGMFRDPALAVQGLNLICPGKSIKQNKTKPPNKPTSPKSKQKSQHYFVSALDLENEVRFQTNEICWCRSPTQAINIYMEECKL